MFIHGKSLPITVYVLEDNSKRSYSTGGQFGTTHVVSSNTQYQTISEMIVHEKQMGATNKAYILMTFLLLQDGTIEVSQNTIVSGIFFFKTTKRVIEMTYCYLLVSVVVHLLYVFIFLYETVVTILSKYDMLSMCTRR